MKRENLERVEESAAPPKPRQHEVEVIVCPCCGGDHPNAHCPVAWAKFNRWFAQGLAERKAKKVAGK